jgi:hypothetical protein
MSSQPQSAADLPDPAARISAATVQSRPWHSHLTRHPWWKLAIAALLLLAVVYAGWKLLFAPQTTLVVRGTHNFRSAELTISIDGSVVRQAQLTGATRKKFGLLESIQGSFAETLAVPAGSHQVTIQVSSPEEGYDETKNVSGDFAEDRERTLTVTAERRGALYLAWHDGGGVQAPKAASTLPVMGKLFASLLLTIAGSMLSAVVGFLVQERMRALRDKSPKG